MTLEKEPCINIEPTTNIKCIYFTLFVLGVYLLPKNKWILLFLLWVPYLLMAMYDEWYSCERTFGPTYLRFFYEWAKPTESKQMKIYKNWCPEQSDKVFKADMVVLFLFLIFFFRYFLKWKWP